jgi:hypothetical protein
MMAALREIRGMERFKVQRFDGSARLVGGPSEVTAASELQAAEAICGGPLIPGGKPALLQAEVWPVSKPGSKSAFYRQPRILPG